MKKIAYFSNTDFSLYNFRRGLMKEMKVRDYKVYVCGKATDEKYIEKINKEFIFKEFNLKRGIDWFGGDLVYFCKVFSFCKKEKPDICHNFNIKPCIFASLAQKLAGVKKIYCTVTGLGYAFKKKNILNKLAIFLYGISFKFVDKVIFQNLEDQQIFIDLKILKDNKAILIKSSGVNIKEFSLKNINQKIKESIKKDVGVAKGKIIIALISRMLWDKGIGEFIESAEKLKNKYNGLDFLLVGPVDRENPSGIPEGKIKDWENKGFIKYLKERDDIRELLSLVDIFVLPSYREGVSRVLLEAGAMELPIITTNVPGCREVVDDNINGFLVEPRNSVNLAEKIEILIKNKDLRKKFGEASRKKIEEEFNEEKVISETLKAYDIY